MNPLIQIASKEPPKINKLPTDINEAFLNVQTAIPALLQLAFQIATIIFVIFVVYGGLQWMLSLGNEENTKKAQRLLFSSATGLLLILGSWAIMTFFFNFFGYQSSK